ncbi:MAG: 16S rRNA processing protein RimM [Lachnospiraceae bacterium]|nr:16S rRNA processing protein RimM [Lachnospiraceae bacterium]
MEDNDFLVLGKVSAPVGFKGNVRIKVKGKRTDEVRKMPRLFIDGEEYAIEHARLALQSDAVVMKLAGVDDRNAAMKLCKKQVAVRWDDAPELPEDTYYIRDLIGMAVVDENGTFLGTVVNVILGRHECYEIARGKTLEELKEIEQEQQERAKENAEHMAEFSRKAYAKPGGMLTASKEIKEEKQKLTLGENVEKFVIPIHKKYVERTDVKGKTLYVKNLDQI